MSLTQIATDGTKLLNTANTRGLLDVAPSTTTLAAAITTTTQAAITLTSGTAAVNGAYIQIGTEKLLVVSGGGTANLNVDRAQDGTTAATYSSGDTVHLPGKLIFQLLSIAAAPNIDLFLHKSTTDINYAEITAATGNTFPGGGTTLLLIDSGANSSVQLKFPALGTVIIVAAGGGAQAGPAGPAGAPGASATPPGDFTIGAVTAEWVVISA